MAKFSGNNASVSFGGTAYSCLGSYRLSQTNNVAKQSCSGSSGAVMHKSSGVTDSTLTFDHLLEANDITTINALTPGTSGALELHPEGDSIGNIEATATSAVVASAELGASVGDLTILSITLEIDGNVTFAAAA